jgi:hypothetical protein
MRDSLRRGQRRFALPQSLLGLVSIYDVPNHCQGRRLAAIQNRANDSLQFDFGPVQAYVFRLGTVDEVRKTPRIFDSRSHSVALIRMQEIDDALSDEQVRSGSAE